jgi:hypothetical protein
LLYLIYISQVELGRAIKQNKTTLCYIYPQGLHFCFVVVVGLIRLLVIWSGLGQLGHLRETLQYTKKTAKFEIRVAKTLITYRRSEIVI